MKNQYAPTFKRLQSREEVVAGLIKRWHPRRLTELVPVDQALGRIPARDVRARVTLPVVRASAGDGVAVRSADFAQGMPDTAGWVQGRDFVRADTGDDFDDAFDAVIMIEDVTLTPEGGIAIREGVRVTPGSGVRPAGSTVKAGERLAQAGLPLRPRDLAGLEMGGVEEVEVWRRPVAAFIPTGSELIPPGTPLSRGKTYDTNSLLVRETLRELGAEPLIFPIVPDVYEDMAQALDRALDRADLVILGGGSSKGDEDISATLLHERGEVLCHGAQAVPGKPLCTALIGGKPVLNLPGPMMAAYHGLEWCVSALVAHYLGRPVRRRTAVEATLTAPVKGSDQVSMLLVVEVTRKADGSGYWAAPYNFKTLPLGRVTGANGQYMTRLGEQLQAGDTIRVELLRGVEDIPVGEETP